jgi:hypothetical protein
VAKAYRIRKESESDELLSAIDLKEKIAKAVSAPESFSPPADPFAGEEARERKELRARIKSVFSDGE